MRSEQWIIYSAVCVAVGGACATVTRAGDRALAETTRAHAKQHASFSSMQTAGERAILDLQSSGCFQTAHFQFTYSASPTPQVCVIDKTGGSKNLSKKGIVVLTPAQVLRFDNLLAFYRMKKSSGCTTEDRVTFTLQRDGRTVRSETFVDASCDRSRLEDADKRDLAMLGEARLPTLSLNRLIGCTRTSISAGTPIPYQDTPREETEAFLLASCRSEEVRRNRQANAMMKDLPGFATMAKRFDVKQVMLGNINMLPFSLHTDLKAKTPGLIESSRWFDPVVNNRAKYDWNQFLQVQAEVERVAGKHLWLRAWKNAHGGRVIESQIFGMTPDTETDTDEYVLPAWRHAGLRGKPRYELLLRRTDDTCISVYLGKEDSRALIVSATPPKKEKHIHPLDTLDLSYHPTQNVPEYIVVSPTGTIARNTRPDRITPAWFAKKANLRFDKP